MVWRKDTQKRTPETWAERADELGKSSHYSAYPKLMSNGAIKSFCRSLL